MRFFEWFQKQNNYHIHDIVVINESLRMALQLHFFSNILEKSTIYFKYLLPKIKFIFQQVVKLLIWVKCISKFLILFIIDPSPG